MMKNDKKNSVPIASLAILPFICVALGCVFWFIYAVLYHDAETTLVDTCVAIDLSDIPAQPTERYWYDLAVEILKDNGWDLPFNATSMIYSDSTLCEPTQTLYVTDLYFEGSYLDGIIPRSKFASIKLNLVSETASIVITSQPFVWTDKSEGIDISQMTIDSYEAIKMADDFAGGKFRNKVGNACEVRMSLANKRWRFRYGEIGKPLENWVIKINAINGKIEQQEFP